MKTALIEKLKESLFSILPVIIIVLISLFLPFVNLSGKELVIFLVSAVFLVLGVGLFHLGADMAITPMGGFVGNGLTKTRKIGILVSVCFIMTMLIIMAEPDLSITADQVSSVIDTATFMAAVGAGGGFFVMIAVLRIVLKKDLNDLLMFNYLLIFSISAVVVIMEKEHMVPLAFDAGGVTTGPITVPFMMGLSLGIANAVGGRHANENSFGMIALSFFGPVLATLILSAFSGRTFSYILPDYSVDVLFSSGVPDYLTDAALDIVRTLAFILIFFIGLDIFILKLPRKRLARIFVGMGYTLIGLIIFVSAITIGFMPVGYKLGCQITEFNPKYTIIFGFIIGFSVVLAEPSIYVLNRQVESVTKGMVSRRSMMIALAIGEGLAVGLSMIRIVYKFSIFYYLIPGFLISLGLSLFVPKIYTAIAFDSGGVASGPITTSFIFPMSIGVCSTLTGRSDLLEYSFGVVAIVAMIPLISIQVLGFRAIFARIVKEKHAIMNIMKAEDEQIIYFDVN